MNIFNKLASQQNRTDEEPNIKLAHELVNEYNLEAYKKS
jgi:hypothetical protein